MTTHAPPTHHIVLLQALYGAPNRVQGLVEDLPAEAHDWRPRSQDWSVHQTVAHLSAAEPPFLNRLTRIRLQDNPWLPYFGPDVARPETAVPLDEAMIHFRQGRDRLLRFLAGLSPRDWERPAIHETLGRTTLARQVQNVINHDADHLGQLYKLREAWENRTHV